MSSNIFTPENDGITHINIYSQGKTLLGRKLSHFDKAPFVHPYFGLFQSMEGFWYYVRADTSKIEAEKLEKLRSLYGHEAKFYGKKLPSRFLPSFNTVIMDANFQKIIQNPDIVELMIKSVLPFDHYYVNRNTSRQIRIQGFEWLINGFEVIREQIKQGQNPEPLDYEALMKN